MSEPRCPLCGTISIRVDGIPICFSCRMLVSHWPAVQALKDERDLWEKRTLGTLRELTQSVEEIARLKARIAEPEETRDYQETVDADPRITVRKENDYYVYDLPGCNCGPGYETPVGDDTHACSVFDVEFNAARDLGKCRVCGRVVDLRGPTCKHERLNDHEDACLDCGAVYVDGRWQ